MKSWGWKRFQSSPHPRPSPIRPSTATGEGSNQMATRLLLIAARPDRGPIRRAIDRRHGSAAGSGGRSAGADPGRAPGAMGAAGLLLQPDATLPANGSGRGPRLAAAGGHGPPRDRFRRVGNANLCRSGRRQPGAGGSLGKVQPRFRLPGRGKRGRLSASRSERGPAPGRCRGPDRAGGHPRRGRPHDDLSPARAGAPAIRGVRRALLRRWR